MTKQKKLALVFFLGLVASQATYAQDPYAQIEQIRREAAARELYYAQQAVQAYRQETGDYQTSDIEVYKYLVRLSQQTNPGFYANLRAQEAVAARRNAAYAANSNAILDGMYNGYMQRSNYNSFGQYNYIQQGIWERDLYWDDDTDTGFYFDSSWNW